MRFGLPSGAAGVRPSPFPGRCLKPLSAGRFGEIASTPPLPAITVVTSLAVDEESTDDSYEWASAAAGVDARVQALRDSYDMGQRKRISHAVGRASPEILVSVDSGVLRDRCARRELLARFTSCKQGTGSNATRSTSNLAPRHGLHAVARRLLADVQTWFDAKWNSRTCPSPTNGDLHL
jgi:hypothetical protein